MAVAIFLLINPSFSVSRFRDELLGAFFVYNNLKKKFLIYFLFNNLKKYSYAIKELLNTEIDYVNDLAILIEVNLT